MLQIHEHIFDRFSDRLHFLHEVGTGAFGRVVKAYDVQIQRVVAVKILLKKNLNSNYINKIRSEAQILAQMKHPNIVEFIDVKESESKVLIEMEYMEGGQLKQYISSRKQ